MIDGNIMTYSQQVDDAKSIHDCEIAASVVIAPYKAQMNDVKFVCMESK